MSNFKTLDKMFGIQGARDNEKAPPREMQVGETIGGEVIDCKMNEYNHMYYVVEADNGEHIKVPSEGIIMEKGEMVDVTRHPEGYEADWSRDYGR